MLNRWSDTTAALCPDALALRAYSSRLLGGDPSLVLHGGGNTSVKLGDTLWVKGSGSDLAKVTPADFTPLRLQGTRALLNRDQMTNAEMMAALTPLISEAGRPKPSIETLLHGALPYAFVEHTHADAILAVTNTMNGEAIAARVFGTRAPRAPFRQSGFDLAKACMQTFDRERQADTVGLILLQHGVFAFGDGARQSYGNMIGLVATAERYLQDHGAWQLPDCDARPCWSPVDVARLRRDISLTAGFPLLLAVQDDPQTLAFARRDDLAQVLEQGPATPQHAVFIKRLPMTGTGVAAYAAGYRAYACEAADALDPAPRVVLDPAFGALVAGYGVDTLGMACDIFRHGRTIMTRASAHDRYSGLPAAAILEAEIHYGGFERRMLQAGAPKDRLRGLCVGIALAQDSAALATALAEHGAAVVDASTDTARDIVARYGGLDAVITDVHHAGRFGGLHALIDQAPFGGKQLDASLETDELIARLTPP